MQRQKEEVFSVKVEKDNQNLSYPSDSSVRYLSQHRKKIIEEGIQKLDPTQPETYQGFYNEYKEDIESVISTVMEFQQGDRVQHLCFIIKISKLESEAQPLRCWFFDIQKEAFKRIDIQWEMQRKSITNANQLVKQKSKPTVAKGTEKPWSQNSFHPSDSPIGISNKLKEKAIEKDLFSLKSNKPQAYSNFYQKYKDEQNLVVSIVISIQQSRSTRILFAMWNISKQKNETKPLRQWFQFILDKGLEQVKEMQGVGKKKEKLLSLPVESTKSEEKEGNTKEPEGGLFCFSFQSIKNPFSSLGKSIKEKFGYIYAKKEQSPLLHQKETLPGSLAAQDEEKRRLLKMSSSKED